MNSLIPVFVCSLIVLTFGALLLALARLLGIKNQLASQSKKQVYECGLSGEEKKGPVSVSFYLTAMLFILFDIEIIFLYPWAVSFNDFLSQGEGAKVFLAMILFLGLFVFGLVWEILSQALKWK